VSAGADGRSFVVVDAVALVGVVLEYRRCR